MMEAGATGLYLIAPTIVHTAYMDESVAQLIPSRRVPAGLEELHQRRGRKF
jgi:hypothetical protein